MELMGELIIRLVWEVLWYWLIDSLFRPLNKSEGEDG